MLGGPYPSVPTSTTMASSNFSGVTAPEQKEQNVPWTETFQFRTPNNFTIKTMLMQLK